MMLRFPVAETKKQGRKQVNPRCCNLRTYKIICFWGDDGFSLQ